MAPFDLPQTTTMLPSPRLGDLKAKTLHTNIRNSVNGTIYSYVKSNTTYLPTESGWVELERYKISWDFWLRRGKADELFQFVNAYYAVRWRVIDWKERVYRVYLVNDPLDFTCTNRGEMYSVRLELEGEEIVREANVDGDIQP